MPQNWTTHKLKEITTKIGSGATPRGGKGAYKDSGISLIRSQNVLDFSFSSDGLAFIDDDQASALNNVTLESQDVLLNITGDSVARVCKAPDHWLPARVNQHVAIVRANEKILNPDFLLYSLLSKENKNLFLTMAGAGATRNALTKTMIEEFEISVPEIEEQKSIASILSALDDKIELNLQMNKTLEEMAMALYKQWFVDFGPFQNGEFVDSELGKIPKGWEVKELQQLALFKNGKGIKREFIDDNGAYNVFGSNGKIGRTNEEMFKKPVIAIGRVGANYGEVHYSVEPCWISDNAVTVQPINKDDFWWLLQSLRGIDYKNFVGGSAQPLITQGAIKQVKFAVPNSSYLTDCSIKLSLLFNQIENNNIENQTLTQLRDTLLPKLISGEVRVKDVEKTLSQVL